jgi:hypothetical protein
VLGFLATYSVDLTNRFNSTTLDQKSIDDAEKTDRRVVAAIVYECAIGWILGLHWQ